MKFSDRQNSERKRGTKHISTDAGVQDLQETTPRRAAAVSLCRLRTSDWEKERVIREAGDVGKEGYLGTCGGVNAFVQETEFQERRYAGGRFLCQDRRWL